MINLLMSKLARSRWLDIILGFLFGGRFYGPRKMQKKKKEKKRLRQYHLDLTLGKQRIYLSICKGYIFIILGIIL